MDLTKPSSSFICVILLSHLHGRDTLCENILSFERTKKNEFSFGSLLTYSYLCLQKYNNDMETATLNPTQMHLLKLFAFNNSEEYAREIQMVLTQHFQSRLDAEADRLWDEGILNQEKLDELRHKDLHAE